MARINEYIRSLPGVARKSIERVLSDAGARGATPTIRDSEPISADGIYRYATVTATKVNTLLAKMAKKNANCWNAVNEVDEYIRMLSEKTDATVSGAASSLNKTRAVLDGIYLSAARKESIDSMYVETFSGTQGTDAELTTARIDSGFLQLPHKSVSTASGQWSVKNVLPTMATAQIDPASGHLFATTKTLNVGRSSDKLKVTAVMSMASPTMVSNVSINASAVEIEAMRIINAGGVVKSIDISNRTTTNGIVDIAFERTSVSAVEIDFVQSHYTVISSLRPRKDDGFFFICDEILRLSPQGSDTNASGLVDAGRLTDAVETMPAIVRSSVGCEYTISVPSIFVQDIIREESAVWVSSPITIQGDVRRTFLSVSKVQNTSANDTWMISVEGKPWVPIVPTNDRKVYGEILDVDFSGLTNLKYPADSSADLHLQGVPQDAVVNTVNDEAGNIVGIRVDKTLGGFVTIDYTAAYSGIVKLDEIGLTNSDIRVMDAMQGGLLGEHAQSVAGKMTLGHSPHGPVDVYVDGVLAVQLESNQSFSDPTLDSTKKYCKVVGKTVIFDGPQVNVSVYYKYAQTSIRIKALLGSSKASNGTTPRIDAITLGVKTISA